MMVRSSVLCSMYQKGFWARYVGDKDSRSVLMRLHVEEDGRYVSTPTYAFQTSGGRWGGGKVSLAVDGQVAGFCAYGDET